MIAPAFNLHEIILAAKLGRSRRDAQVDTCVVFAAALYDVLSARGIACQIVTAIQKGRWAHALVEVDGRYYDSLGEFSTLIYRQRTKVHPSVSQDLIYQPDSRAECYEPEFDVMHAFYVKMLQKALVPPGPRLARPAPTLEPHLCP